VCVHTCVCACVCGCVCACVHVCVSTPPTHARTYTRKRTRTRTNAHTRIHAHTTHTYIHTHTHTHTHTHARTHAYIHSRNHTERGEWVVRLVMKVKYLCTRVTSHFKKLRTFWVVVRHAHTLTYLPTHTLNMHVLYTHVELLRVSARQPPGRVTHCNTLQHTATHCNTLRIPGW